MLPLQRCRELLGDPDISDSQLEAAREQLYLLARAACAAYASAGLTFDEAVGEVDADERVSLEERAAILEFDANLPRSIAERRALTEKRRHRRQ